MKKPSPYWLTIISLVISVIAAEFFLKYFFPYPDPFANDKTTTRSYIPSAFPPYFKMRFAIEDGLPGIEQKEVDFSVNNMGFRGDTLLEPKPAGEYRIFLVGGSTTECRVVDDSQELGRALQNQLNDHLAGEPNIKVYNAGISGDKSFDHVAMIAHRIIHLQPDVITVFAGINDLVAAANGADYLHYRESGSREQDLVSSLKYAATDFQIGRRIFGIIDRFGQKDDKQLFQEIRKRTNFRNKAKARMRRPVSDAPPKTDLAHYRNNLLTIIGIAKAHKIPLVLMTQATTWNSKVDAEAENWHWMALAFDKYAYNEDLLDKALESYNDVMRQLAADYDVPILDLARVLPKSLEFFCDDCHFNVKGARVAASLLSDIIQKEFVAAPGARGKINQTP
jgi:lysophospholipase L1-like esterase